MERPGVELLPKDEGLRTKHYNITLSKQEQKVVLIAALTAQLQQLQTLQRPAVSIEQRC